MKKVNLKKIITAEKKFLDIDIIYNRQIERLNGGFISISTFDEIKKERENLLHEYRKLEYILQKIIDKQEGNRISVRKLKVKDIIYSLKKVEEWLKERKLTKKNFIGTQINIDVNAQNFPHAYEMKAKSNPQSTLFTVELTKNGWVLLNVFRADCLSERFNIKNLNEETKKELIKSALNLY